MLLANSENPYYHIEIGNEKSRSFSNPGQFANNIYPDHTPLTAGFFAMLTPSTRRVL
jgi:hypothetical protein